MPDAAAASQLLTVRDFLRYAVLSEFRAAKIIHGHGTTSALDRGCLHHS